MIEQEHLIDLQQIGKDYDGEIISAKGKTAYVKIGDAKFNGTVFSKFKGYEKESRVKLHVTLPDVTGVTVRV